MIFNFLIFFSIIALYLMTQSNRLLKSEKKQLLFLKISFFIFFIFVAFRGFNIGNDTKMYLNLFTKCYKEGIEAIEFGGYYEVGYLILNILIGFLSNNKRFFMIIMSLILNYGAYKFIKDNSKNYFMSTIIYVGLLFLYTSMTMMRQFTAMIIVLYGIKFAKDKNIIKFCATILFASLFHTSALICFVYYFIVNSKFTNKKLILIILLSIISMNMVGPLTNLYYQITSRTNYYENRLGSDSYANIIYTIVYSLLFIFCYIQTNKKSDKENSFYLMAMLFAISANMLGINMNILSRVSVYFNILVVIALPNLIETFYTKKENKIFVELLLVIFFFTYSSTIMYFRPEWNSAYNYQICSDINGGCFE